MSLKQIVGITGALVFAVVAFLLTIHVALSTEFSAVLASFNEILEHIQPVLPFLPLLFYALLALITHKFLWKDLRDATALSLDRDEASSLSLAGFCFTSFSFLLGFYKDEFKRAEAGPEQILIFFAVALGSFVISYIVLRFGTRHLTLLLNQAFLDNGIWCVLVGFWQFSNHNRVLSRLLIVFAGFILIYTVYLFLHFAAWIEIAFRKPDPSAPAAPGNDAGRDVKAPAVR